MIKSKKHISAALGVALLAGMAVLSGCSSRTTTTTTDQVTAPRPVESTTTTTTQETRRP